MDILDQKFDFVGGPYSIVKQIAVIQKRNDLYESDEVIWDYCNSIWCKRDPKRCLSEQSMKENNMSQTKSKALRFLIALRALVKNGMQPVEQKLAEDRSRICSKCPYNKRTETCGMCIATARAITKGLLGQRQTLYDRRLKQCDCCGCELKAKVHFPITEDGVTYPKHCWVTTERNSGRVQTS
jgi:hypothetical protein